MNLIICYTPFQILIAEKIMDIFPDDKFYAIVITKSKNNKYTHYKERLFEKVKNSRGKCLEIFEGKTNKLGFLLFLLSIKIKGLLLPRFDKVFISNVDSYTIQILLSNIKFKENHTFDDGTSNLLKSSWLYKEHVTSGLGKIAFYFLGNKYNSKILREKSVAHYSIYNRKDNIVSPDKIKYIKLFNFTNENVDASNLEEGFSKKDIVIFLGQPVYELCDGFSREEIERKNIRLAEYIVNKFNVDYYFPHPRELYKISNVEYIDSEMIFEDYFLRNKKQNVNYTIYTLFSGAVLSLIELDKVKIFSLKPSDYPEKLCDCYDLMRDFNIPVIDI